MNSHLVIRVDGKDMALKPDQSIDITDQNPLFNDVEMYSLPFEPPFELNRHLFSNMDDPDSSLRPVDLEHRPAQIIADGLPLRSGLTLIQEDETLESGMSMNIDASERSFDDLIGDLECRDVPLKDSIQIGEKIGNVHVYLAYDYKVKVQYEGKKGDAEYHYDNDTVEGEFEPQALGFSYPGICAVTGKQVAQKKTERLYPGGNKVIVPKEATNYANSTFINVTDAYGDNSEHWGEGGAKYCNARICYKHYGLDEDGKTSSEVVQLTDYLDNKKQKYPDKMYEDYYPYWVLEADRPQSGICFYVLYFLDCLFAHLGVSFDKTALTAIEDFKHLCFFTTKCKYDSEVIDDVSHSFSSMEEANTWLDSRGCGGQFGIEDPEPKQLSSFDYKKNNGEWQTVKVGKDGVQSITVTATIRNYSFTANVCKMWANSDNFPEESVKTILDSLQNSFGIRFHYDYEKNKVTAYLLRSVFRSTEDPIDFMGEVLSMRKMSEKITGFRMKYSAEGTAKEQADYIRRQKRDYNTDFDYMEYPQGRVVLDKTFVEIAGSASATNMKVYVDLVTGNAYRFKVDTETLSQARLFEVGQFHGIEVGDCSPENDEFVREYVSDFQPISFNDVNAWRNMGSGGSKEYTYRDGNDTYTIKGIQAGGQPILVAYMDEDMEHEFVEQKINNVLSSDLVDIYLTEYLKTVESYDPTKTDDGNSPLQEYDWGLAVAMMRGGGTNMELQRYDNDYDGFGNDKWRTVAGEYALTSDTIDQMGNAFDYNGVLTGVGDGERFSLKITGYRPFRYKEVAGETIISTDPKEWDSTWLVPCNNDIINAWTGEVVEKIRSRGLYDSFMSELAYFLLHRKKYKIRVLTTVAQLADIPNHWLHRYRIGDRIGYIDKVNYSLWVEKETREAEIDFYTI